MLFPARMDALVFGGLLALLARDPDGVATLVRQIRPALAMGAAGLVAAVAWSVTTLPAGEYLPATALHVQLIAYPAIALLAGAVLVAALDGNTFPRLQRALCSPVLMRFGKYSYGLYILHILLRDFLRDRYFGSGTPVVMGTQIPSAILIIAMCIGASFVVAWVSWHLYEKHFLGLKRFFEYKRPDRDEAVVPSLSLNSTAPVG
jgi:peptidoglycan/LPS O-acetylase OafA/YrhL